MSKQALVVRGGWDGHTPVGATDLFIPYLREHDFEVDVRDTPEVYADAALMAGVDLVVQCVTMSEASKDAVAGLRAAVEAGTGFAGWHGGIADSYRASADYLQLVGGQFATHPPEEPHARTDWHTGERLNFIEHSYQVIDHDHPVTAGIEDFTLTTEQYWVLTDDLLDVHVTTTLAARPDDPWHRPITCPAVWTRRWGAGKMFVATPGHSLDVLQHPTVRTLVERGLLWASR